MLRNYFFVLQLHVWLVSISVPISVSVCIPDLFAFVVRFMPHPLWIAIVGMQFVLTIDVVNSPLKTQSKGVLDFWSAPS